METATLQLVIETIKLALLISLPLMAAVLVAGLASGAFQAMTTVSDASLSTVPRLVAGGLTLLVAGPWIATRVVEFAVALLADLGRFTGS
jgi:flagellar biosynthetic protein FliQ